MENASKALVMAGSVLIALLIIGALLLMFNNLSSYQGAGTQETRETQVIEFNNQFETFNRKNVRGSDLYSLLNKVVDYNRRKSTKGTGGQDEGQYLAYQPISVKIDFAGKNNLFSVDGIDNQLIKNPSYTQSATENDFETKLNQAKEKAEKALRRRNDCTKFKYRKG